METLHRKEQILKAFKEGKIIQSKDGNKWTDFIPQNQLDRPNLDYGGIDNWRIKGETMETPKHKPHVNIGQIRCDGRGGFLGVLPKDYPSERELLQNALHKIEKLQADKAELLEALEKISKVTDEGYIFADTDFQVWESELKQVHSEIESLIQKHKQ